MEGEEKPKPEIAENREAPCVESGCSYCCDPVKVAFRKGFNPDRIPIPKDSTGNELWEARGEVWIPEHEIDHVRVQTYNCKKLDKETGRCLDYENRPDICRNTTCIREGILKSIEEQRADATGVNFIKLKK